MFKRLPDDDKCIFDRINNYFGLTHQREKEIWPWGFAWSLSPSLHSTVSPEFTQCAPMEGTASFFFFNIYTTLSIHHSCWGKDTPFPESSSNDYVRWVTRSSKGSYLPGGPPLGWLRLSQMVSKYETVPGSILFLFQFSKNHIYV